MLTYFLFLAPALLLSFWAQQRVTSAYRRYSSVIGSRGFSGAQAAQAVLSEAGIHDVQIVPAHGFLSDHYNPVSKKLALSRDVYNGRSVAALGIAAHEAGHAIQHATNYFPLWVRTALVPTANLGSSIGYLVMLGGLIASQLHIFLIGVALFSMVLLFQVVTLPVEFDASARAKRLLVEHGLIEAREREGVDCVLNAAALTYIAAAVSTLMTLLYFLSQAGLLGRRD